MKYEVSCYQEGECVKSRQFDKLDYANKYLNGLLKMLEYDVLIFHKDYRKDLKIWE